VLSLSNIEYFRDEHDGVGPENKFLMRRMADARSGAGSTDESRENPTNVNMDVNLFHVQENLRSVR
jgi:hypothetical protein